MPNLKLALWINANYISIPDIVVMYGYKTCENMGSD